MVVGGGLERAVIVHRRHYGRFGKWWWWRRWLAGGSDGVSRKVDEDTLMQESRKKDEIKAMKAHVQPTASVKETETRGRQRKSSTKLTSDARATASFSFVQLQISIGIRSSS